MTTKEEKRQLLMEFIAFYDKVNNNSPLSEYDADRFLSTLPDEGEKTKCNHPDEYYFKDEDRGGSVYCTFCGEERPS